MNLRELASLIVLVVFGTVVALAAIFVLFPAPVPAPSFAPVGPPIRSVTPEPTGVRLTDDRGTELDSP